MMKYKVGDKVKIVEKKVGDNWNEDMFEWLGKVMTVRRVGVDYYRMKEDATERFGDGWCWSDYMIEGLVDEPQSKMADVAALFDLALGQEFNIDGYSYNPHRFTRNGLVDCDNAVSFVLLTRLLKGDITYEKIQRIPKDGERYFYIMGSGDINSTIFDEKSTFDRAMILTKNYFSSYSSAERNKEKVKKEWKEYSK